MRVRRISGEELKLAVCISRKTASRAVDRNRLKRITRVALDPHIAAMQTGYYVAFFPRPRFETLTPEERSQAVGALIRRAGLFASQKGERKAARP